MYHVPSAFPSLAPSGDPSPEAIHREDFLTNKPEAVAAPERSFDHRAAARSRSLRAQVAERVGQFFSVA